MEKRTLIIDQSSSCCGFAILQGDDLLEHGNLTSREKTSTLRLREFMGDLRALAWAYKINEVVFEEIHYHGMHSADSIEGLAPGAFLCKLTAEELGLPWYRVPPQCWKAACSVRGRTSEQQKNSARERACQRWELQPNEIKSNDHSDALCIAAYWVVYRDEYRQRGLTKGGK